MMFLKYKTEMVGVLRRLARTIRRVPLSVRLGVLVSVVAVLAVVIGIAGVNGRYQLSDAQHKLLSKSGIDPKDLKETAHGFTYNMALDVQDDPVKKVVAAASASDSTPDTAYQATLPKDPSKGITFGDAEGNLSFNIIPEQPLMDGRASEGRIIYPSSTGKKSVYTFKRNGIKEDILLDRAPSKVAEYSWKLELGDKLEARQLPDGSIGIFSADPYLYGQLQIADEKSQALVDKARTSGKKDHLVFNLPAPFIVDADGRRNVEDVSYKLEGNVLTLEARNLQNKKYPLSIDPTVVVTTTAEFRTGFDDGMVDYTTTSNQITRGTTSAGSIGAFATDGDHIAEPRSAHASVAYNGYLYVIGGVTTNVDACENDAASTINCNDVQYAQINSDGTIGAFTTDGDHFSDPRGYLSAVAYNGYLYVIGGSGTTANACDVDAVSTVLCDDVQYAVINSNGSIGSFTTDGDHFSIPRYGHTSVAYNGYLYVIGGANATNNACDVDGATTVFCDDVQYAPINADGTIGAFVTDGDHFADPRLSHASIAYNGYLYIGGGQNPTNNACDVNAATTVNCDDVQYAQINSNGSIGAFTVSDAHFAIPRTFLAFAARGGYLYVIGGSGISGNACEVDAVVSFECDDVQYAPINADGSISAFTTDGSHFSEPRYSHASVTYNGYIYVVAGAGDDTNSDDCEIAGASITLCDDVQYAAFDTGSPTGAEVQLWQTDTDTVSYFDEPRTSHASVAYNGYLYVLGGSVNASTTNCKPGGSGASQFCSDVQYAPINSNGSIGDWQTDTDTVSYFDTPRSGLSAFVYNGYLYIVGGGPSDDVQYVTINSDGSVGDWQTNSTTFQYARTDQSAFAYNGYLYVVGGIHSASNLCEVSGLSETRCDDVQYAAIDPDDGSVGTFTTDGDHFLYPRSALASFAYNGYLYVAGGSRTSATIGGCQVTGGSLSLCDDIQYAQINSDGSINSFTTNTGHFAQPRMRLAAFSYDGYMYVSGGFQSTNDTACKDFSEGANRYCSDVQYALINGDGSVGGFSLDVDGYFQYARHVTGYAVYNGYFYVVGGFKPTVDTNCKNSGASSSSYCNDTQYAGILRPADRATYERVLDVGEAAPDIRMNSVTYNGQAVCTAKLSYRLAGTNGVFGAAVLRDSAVEGSPVTIDQTNVRYIWLKYTLTDESCGTTSYITDITLDWQYDPPAAPTLNTPADGAISLGTQPSFQARTTQLSNYYLRYRIYIWRNDGSGCNVAVSGSPFDQTVSQTGWSGQDTQTSTAYVGNSVITSSTMATYTYQGTLSFNKEYCWEAQAIDPARSNTWSANSVRRTFYTNLVPVAPTLNAPLNNASGTSLTPEFRFVTTDQDGDYIRYRIYICQDFACSSQVSGSPFDQTVSQTGWLGQGTQAGTAYSSGQEAIFQIQTPLNVSTQYWWQVEATDPGGTNLWSAVSSKYTFTTGTTTGIQTLIRGGTTLKGGTGF